MDKVGRFGAGHVNLESREIWTLRRARMVIRKEIVR